MADVRPPGRVHQVDPLIKQLPQPEVLGQAGRSDQPGVGHQPLVVKGRLDRSSFVARSTHPKGAFQ